MRPETQAVQSSELKPLYCNRILQKCAHSVEGWVVGESLASAKRWQTIYKSLVVFITSLVS